MAVSRFWLPLIALTQSCAALACPPPYVPPRLVGETEEEYQPRIDAHFKAQRLSTLTRFGQFQSQYFEAAPEAFVARVVDRKKSGWREQAVLEPVKWIKGEGRKKRYKVRMDFETSCGPVGGGDAVNQPLGSLVLVMLQASKDKWTRADRNFSLDNIQDQSLRAKLIAAGFEASGGI